jgi:hypothetical protein
MCMVFTGGLPPVTVCLPSPPSHVPSFPPAAPALPFTRGSQPPSHFSLSSDLLLALSMPRAIILLTEAPLMDNDEEVAVLHGPDRCSAAEMGRMALKV